MLPVFAAMMDAASVAPHHIHSAVMVDARLLISALPPLTCEAMLFSVMDVIVPVVPLANMMPAEPLLALLLDEIVLFLIVSPVVPTLAVPSNEIPQSRAPVMTFLCIENVLTVLPSCAIPSAPASSMLLSSILTSAIELVPRISTEPAMFELVIQIFFVLLPTAHVSARR